MEISKGLISTSLFVDVNEFGDEFGDDVVDDIGDGEYWLLEYRSEKRECTIGLYEDVG